MSLFRKNSVRDKVSSKKWIYASLIAQLVKNLPAVQEAWVLFLDWKDPLEKEVATHSTILAGEFHGQRSLEGYGPWGRKEWDTTE